MDALGMAERQRGRAESRMLSRATVRRESGTTTNPDGFEVPGWLDVYTDLPFRLGGADQGGAGTRTVTVGGTEVQVAVRTGSFPASTTNLRDGDLIEVTAGENAGTVWQIVEADFQDQATARRVPIVNTARPAEWV